ncbi:hypothetical protein Asp14428_75730 [Actinoplanes sp. NBRC 14428]|nr:hypothetical protein Asp14428_75730 [Actinoplanes sp. NBRC 14428]
MTERFAVQRHDDGAGTARLAVLGTVDADTSETLLALIDNAAARPEIAAVLLDQHRVLFLDAAGVRAVLTGRDTARRHGCGYVVTGVQETARTVLEVTGVLDVLEIDDAPAPAPARTRPSAG